MSKLILSEEMFKIVSVLFRNNFLPFWRLCYSVTKHCFLFVCTFCLYGVTFSVNERNDFFCFLLVLMKLAFTVNCINEASFKVPPRKVVAHVLLCL